MVKEGEKDEKKNYLVITTFVLILSSHFSMIYALDKPHLNLNEKEDSVEVTTESSQSRKWVRCFLW